jgi:hypothetical protein
MNDDLDRDQRALLWSMRHERVAQRNLDAAADDYPSYADRKLRAACKWFECAHLILHHGYTDIATLAAAWELTLTRTRSSVRKLIRRGALRDVTMPASGKRLIMLTPAGLADARSTLNLDMMCNTNPARIGRTLIGHTLACQRAAIEHDNDGARIWLHTYDLYAVDLQLRSHPFEARPDIILAAYSDATMIEVELARKSPSRIGRKMRGVAALIIDEDKRTSDCVWYCPPGQIADALARARDRLDGRLADGADSIDIVSPEWLGGSLY